MHVFFATALLASVLKPILSRLSCLTCSWLSIKRLCVPRDWTTITLTSCNCLIVQPLTRLLIRIFSFESWYLSFFFWFFFHLVHEQWFLGLLLLNHFLSLDKFFLNYFCLRLYLLDLLLMLHDFILKIRDLFFFQLLLPISNQSHLFRIFGEVFASNSNCKPIL